MAAGKAGFMPPSKARLVTIASSTTSLERGNRLLLTVVHLEDGSQLGDLQHISQPLPKARQFDIRAARSGRRIHTDVGSQAAAINIGHRSEIQPAVPVGTYDLREGLPQRSGFLH